MHDFIDPEMGKAIPYGVYDLGADEGWVSVGDDADTAGFAVATIGRWWAQMGRLRYPGATRLLICCRCRRVERLPDTGLEGRARQARQGDRPRDHRLPLPAGTSKWNKIEHRLFSFITMNWRGRPLTSYRVIVQLIANTTTTKGLKVNAELDQGTTRPASRSPTRSSPLSRSPATSSTVTGTTRSIPHRSSNFRAGPKGSMLPFGTGDFAYRVRYGFRSLRFVQRLDHDYECLRSSPGALWSCEGPSRGSVGNAMTVLTFDEQIGLLSDMPRPSNEASMSSAKLAGVKVACLRYQQPDGSRVTWCITADGITAFAASTNINNVELVKLFPSIPAGIFSLPARPTKWNRYVWPTSP